MIPFAFVFIVAWTSPPERCGVDACAMAMIASMWLSAILFAVLVSGFVLGLMSATLKRRTDSSRVGETFK
jgi:Na+-driven multidrug efflux pump